MELLPININIEDAVMHIYEYIDVLSETYLEFGTFSVNLLELILSEMALMSIIGFFTYIFTPASERHVEDLDGSFDW